eukprot:3941980-Rhodomonas_salina.4
MAYGAMCYGMCGTDIAYGVTQPPVKKKSGRYATCGAELGYVATRWGRRDSESEDGSPERKVIPASFNADLSYFRLFYLGFGFAMQSLSMRSAVLTLPPFRRRIRRSSAVAQY